MNDMNCNMNFTELKEVDILSPRPEKTERSIGFITRLFTATEGGIAVGCSVTLCFCGMFAALARGSGLHGTVFELCSGFSGAAGAGWPAGFAWHKPAAIW